MVLMSNFLFGSCMVTWCITLFTLATVCQAVGGMTLSSKSGRSSASLTRGGPVLRRWLLGSLPPGLVRARCTPG